MSRYLVTGPRPVLDHAPGSEAELVLDPALETDLVSKGLLEILPSTYRNVGTQQVFGHDPGVTFEVALTVGQEAALLEGGHLERVNKPSPQSGTGRKKKEA